MPADDATAPAPLSADFDAQVTGIAALGDPLRRGLYRYVIAQSGPVNRDQVAEGVGVARHVAKFHLDKLVTDGLLAVEYARPPGRRGPGAGRPAKLYSRSSRELAVSLPQRDYEMAGRLLAKAVTTAEHDGVTVGEALRHVSRDTGRALGQRARQFAGARPAPSTLLAAAMTVLGESGYEPRIDGTSVTLVNCPFHGLAQEYIDLVCGMNLDLMAGFVEGLDDPILEARLEPTPGLCCVRLRSPDAKASTV
ncbi:MAG: transcriptional regulator [Acidimicrobiales bacterium]|nr:transcriptional regulator [Acidimicrobiales bacterium]